MLESNNFHPPAASICGSNRKKPLFCIKQDRYLLYIAEKEADYAENIAEVGTPPTLLNDF